jgi:hypothetical protein
MKILVNLISGQTIPNLIAQKYIKPQKVILLFSKGSIKQRDSYKSVLNGIKFEEIEIEPFNYSNIYNEILNVLKNNIGNELILNFTCGTKVMSVASFQAFKNEKLLSIYVDSENGKIFKYNNDSQSTEDINIKITSDEYLKLNGHIYQINSEQEHDDSKKVFYEYMETNYNLSISEFLAGINEKYELNKKQFYINNTKLESNNYYYSWNNESQTSIIKINNQTFSIKGKDSIKYITGMWFEDLVYYKKFLGTKYYDEVIRNIHIQDKKGKQSMIELDIVGLYKNYFHLFELKSGKPRREALNNIRTIKEQLGTYTKLFLISYFDLPENDTLIDRMADLGIKYFKYSDFNLEECFDKSNVNL